MNFTPNGSVSGTGSGSSGARHQMVPAPAKFVVSNGYEIPSGWMPLTPPSSNPCSSKGSSPGASTGPVYENEDFRRHRAAWPHQVSMQTFGCSSGSSGMQQSFGGVGVRVGAPSAPPAEQWTGLAIRDLISFARQVACGMEYLASKKVHNYTLEPSNQSLLKRLNLLMMKTIRNKKQTLGSY